MDFLFLVDEQVTLGDNKSPESPLRSMIEHYYRCHGVPNYRAISDAFISELAKKASE